MNKPETGFSAQALRQILSDCLGEAASLKVAYSGGVDSHVLLHALHELRDDARRHISAIHIDHGLERGSRDWANHCLHVCEKLDVPCTIERIEIDSIGGESREAAARRLRYARLARYVGTNDVLLTGHHLDDQAETVLLQLMRGSGVRGLGAMPVIAPFAEGRLMRPLLGFTRAALVAYAEAHRLRWIEDSSNRDLRYARNFVRHRVLPVLEQRWPQAKQLIARCSGHVAEASSLVDALARNDLETCKVTDKQGLSVSALLRLAPEHRRSALRFWIRQHGFMAPSTLLVERLDGLVTRATKSRGALLAWPGAEVRRYRDTLSIMRPLATPNPNLDLTWDPNVVLEVPGTGYVLRAVPVVGSGLSRERIAGSALSVRLRRGGETCRLPGRRHHHTLKKLLQEAGVPPWERQRLPLIFVGEHLAAIADRWVCEPFAAAATEPGLQVVAHRLGASDICARSGET